MGTQSALKLWRERGYWRSFTYDYDDILSYETEICSMLVFLSLV
jgi:hypothetical protein